jgi:hypothetical protein
MLNKTLALILLGGHAAVFAASQTAPSALQVAAAGDPYVFAMLLAHASVPSGIVLPYSATRHPPGPPDFGFRREPAIPIEGLAKAFDARHLQYRSVLLDGVLVIGPAAGLPEYLNRNSGLRPMEITGVMEATRRVLAALDPAFGKTGGGILGSRLSLDAEQSGESVRIFFDGTERRVVDALNTIARQARRTWIVVTTDEEEAPELLRVGFIHQGGASTGFDLKPRPE